MYNPNEMPKTESEFTQLIDHYYAQDAERHAKAVAEAKARAEVQWQAQASALRDLPSQEGAPWDGGGEQTPWPVMNQEVN